MKIAVLSSRAFGGAPNAYQYQGDYSEFDDDLGWNDFQLRSYDPQLGRFLQWDPYDQFSSGYVGMGADPVNNVDPTVGFLPGGIPCPGTSGLGLFLQSVGNAISNAMPTISTVAAIGSKAASAARIINGLSNHASASRQGLRSSSNSLSGSPEEDGGNSGCPDCPPGYGPKPKNGNNRPYFSTPDEAAVYWAWIHRKAGFKDGVERSSLIYGVDVGPNAKLYASTQSKRFPDLTFWEKLFGYGNDPTSSSPGFDDPLHEKLQYGWEKIGHIHLHPYDPENRKGRATNSDNRTFSSQDYNNMRILSEKYWYVVGVTGVLNGNYPKKMPTIKNAYSYYNDPREGSTGTPSGSKILNFYDVNLPQPKLCPCYKQ